MATPIVPKTKQVMLRTTSIAAYEKYPTSPPPTTKILNPTIIQILISIPIPPNDQALEYIDTIKIKIVHPTISINNPH